MSWKPIDKLFWNGEYVTYKISVTKDNDDVIVKESTTENNNAIIAGLQPDTVYSVSVSGQTTLGNIPTATIRATTKPSKSFTVENFNHNYTTAQYR